MSVYNTLPVESMMSFYPPPMRYVEAVFSPAEMNDVYGGADNWIDEVSSEEPAWMQWEPPWVQAEKGPEIGKVAFANSFGNYTTGKAGPNGEVLAIRHLGPVTKQEDRDNNLKYIRARAARIKYQVFMGSTIKHRGPRIRKGMALDTAAIRKSKIDKYLKVEAERNLPEADRTLPAEKFAKENARPGAFSGGGIAPDWTYAALMWVCVLDSMKKDIRFYTHLCKVNRFHHSTFTHGRGVLGAGEWYVKKGKLKFISANSGHYKPDLSSFHGAVLKMAESFHRDTMVCMWDTYDDKWAHRPVMDFVREPSGNGQYKVSPYAET